MVRLCKIWGVQLENLFYILYRLDIMLYNILTFAVARYIIRTIAFLSETTMFGKLDKEKH